VIRAARARRSFYLGITGLAVPQRVRCASGQPHVEGAFDRRLTGLRKRGLIERRNGKVWATEAGHILAGAQT